MKSGYVMPRISIRVCLLAVLLASALAPAWAQKRMALVIGNGDYAFESKLGNPVNDARLIGRTLRGLGFTVDERSNLRQRDMTLAIAKFTRESAGADTALVYFAGHGMQPSNGGRNYLLPVDANIENDDALDSDGIAADRVVEQMERNANPAKLRLVVLDACRNNPRAGRTRGSVRGLSRMSPGDDYTLIAFSTNDQDVAQDGSGSNSPYAEALNRHLARAKELPLRRIFELTATDVRNATQQKQRPRTYGDLDSRVGLDGVLLASVVPEPVTPLARPGQAGGLSLADLEKEEATRKEWAAWQTRMKADFDKTASFQGSNDLQAKAWERFLGAWAQDNPLSTADEALRAQAQSRLEAARQAVAPAARPVPAALAEPSRASASAGQSVKDCAECPEMVVMPAGSFRMGSPTTDSDRYQDEVPQREVAVRSFLIGKTEVTQGQWKAVMGSNPSRFPGCGDNCPVENVSWNDAQEFARKLSDKTGKIYRLPSEAEWEYAARAGSTTAYPWGDAAGSNNAHCKDCESRWEGKSTAPVAQFKVNAFGLHDMQGNVWEWVQDVYHDSYRAAPTDGTAWVLGGAQERRAIRGGSWLEPSRVLRSATRFSFTSDYRNHHIGFRIASTF